MDLLSSLSLCEGVSVTQLYPALYLPDLLLPLLCQALGFSLRALQRPLLLLILLSQGDHLVVLVLQDSAVKAEAGLVAPTVELQCSLVTGAQSLLQLPLGLREGVCLQTGQALVGQQVAVGQKTDQAGLQGFLFGLRAHVSELAASSLGLFLNCPTSSETKVLTCSRGRERNFCLHRGQTQGASCFQ